VFETLVVVIVFIPGIFLEVRSVVVGPGVVEGGVEAGTEKETEQRDRQV
jgi:hypothetical protein